MATTHEQDDWINPRDPALALGPDGLPARSRRAPFYADVPDEQWNDWRWQLSNRVNELETFAQILELSEEEIAGLGAPDKFRVDITPYFISLIDPKDPNDPIRRQVIPLGREQQAFTAMMEDSLAEDRHSPVPGLVHRYPDRVLMLVPTQCEAVARIINALERGAHNEKTDRENNGKEQETPQSTQADPSGRATVTPGAGSDPHGPGRAARGASGAEPGATRGNGNHRGTDDGPPADIPL